MTLEEVAGLLQYLCKMAGEGYTILTWNGLGFDFDILAEESACGRALPDVRTGPCGYDVSHRLCTGLSGGS